MARTILDRYPTPIAHQLFAMGLLAADNRVEGMSQLRQALPGAPRAHLALGVELFRDGKLDEAIAELQAFIREQPHLADVAEAHEYIGRAFAIEQRWPEAVGQFRQVLEITPSDPSAHRLLAEALFSAQALDESIAHYRAYLDATQWKTSTRSTSLASRSVRLESSMTPSWRFRRAAEVDPASGAAQRNLANALWAGRKSDEAAVHARQAIALQPDDADSHDALGRILEQQGRFGDAAAEYERSLQIDPTFADARSDLERIRQRRGNASPRSRPLVSVSRGLLEALQAVRPPRLPIFNRSSRQSNEGHGSWLRLVVMDLQKVTFEQCPGRLPSPCLTVRVLVVPRPMNFGTVEGHGERGLAVVENGAR